MVPVAEFRAGYPEADLGALPTTGPEADIDELIDLALAHPGPGIAVQNGGGDPLGVVSWRSLLHGIKGSSSEPARA